MEIRVEPTNLLYLDLMKRCLTNWIYAPSEQEVVSPHGYILRKAASLLHSQGFRIVRPKAFDAEKRKKGLDWPTTAHTMIGLERLDNLQFCIEQVLKDNISGDLIETGVWRGGSTIFMRAALKAYGVSDRTVWVADSFQGLPPPDEENYPVDKGDVHHTFDELRISLDQVEANFERYGLLDEQVRFLKGWFKDTLPSAPIEKLAIVRLDGDMYESTMDALKALYPKLSIGGYLIVDDYCIKTCATAIHDYRKIHGIDDEIVPIDGTGVFWKRLK
jgi:O-methyltransferase